jgi:hypothetical protein
MIFAFALGYYYMINGRDRWQEGWEQHLSDAFLLQFNIIFGSFQIDYETDTMIKMIMFMVTSLLMPLLMMNMFIAILANTYQTVTEEWKRNRYA